MALCFKHRNKLWKLWKLLWASVYTHTHTHTHMHRLAQIRRLFYQWSALHTANKLYLYIPAKHIISVNVHDTCSFYANVRGPKSWVSRIDSTSVCPTHEWRVTWLVCTCMSLCAGACGCICMMCMCVWSNKVSFIHHFRSLGDFQWRKVAKSIAPPIGHTYLYFYRRSSN